jgi:transcriptional regulator with XRE-family HTH domain
MRRTDAAGAGALRPLESEPDEEEELLPDSLGARLRAERLRRKISIASIAESTKILGALLEGLEHDDVARWPSGLYRRAFIRAYAAAIGLDPEPVVREFLERFPDPEDVHPVQSAAPGHAAVLRSPRTMLRLTLADPRLAIAPKDIFDELRRRVSAVAFDAFVLSVVGLTMFLALGTLWAPLTVAAGIYYFGSILALGSTPGCCIFSPRPHRFGTAGVWTQGAGGMLGRLRELLHTSDRKAESAPEARSQGA